MLECFVLASLLSLVYDVLLLLILLFASFSVTIQYIINKCLKRLILDDKCIEIKVEKCS